MKIYECIIVGAGAAGIGVALRLEELGVETLILECDTIGSSFKKWNSDTRFISPSFPGNAFGQVDLNSVDYATSPGFMFRKEHLSGVEYAEYLKEVAEEFELNVKEGEKVISIEKKENLFHITSEKNKYSSKFFISAIGEFQFPGDGNIIGSKHGTHSSKIRNYDSYESGNDVVPIIGGYESSIDAAYGLYKKGRKVHIFCPDKMDKVDTSDPSVILSLYSLERLKGLQDAGMVEFTYGHISEIQKIENDYVLVSQDTNTYTFHESPILATGFDTKFGFLDNMISFRPDGNPDLNEYDELKKTENIFIVGPQVRQDEIIFCFIYKFRLRFGVVALEIAKRLGKDIDYKEIQSIWEKQGFFLDELSCCGDECVC